jgi:hypothetical protein
VTVARPLWIAVALACLAAPRALAEGEARRTWFHPGIRVVGVADDNAYLTDDDRQQAFGVWIQPGLDVGYRGRRFEVGADLGADIRQVPGESRLSDEFWRARVFAEAGLVEGLTARISDLYVPHPVELGRPEGDTANLVQSHRIDAQLRYWRELPRAREIEVGLRGSRFISESFPADVLDDDGMLVVDEHFHPDYWEGSAYAELQNPLGRKTALFVRPQLQYRTFDEAPRADHLDSSVLAGIRTRRLQDFEIELAGGWGLLYYDDGGSRDRFLGRGVVRHRLPRGWSWRASAESRFTEDLTAERFAEVALRVGVEKRFGERTLASLDLFATSFESEDKDRDENLFAGAEFALGRQLTRRMQARLRYRHWRNAGDYDFDDFYQNQIALELAYRY